MTKIKNALKEDVTMHDSLFFDLANFLPSSKQLGRVASNKIKQIYGAHTWQYFCVKVVKIIILVDEKMDSNKFAFFKEHLYLISVNWKN